MRGREEVAAMMFVKGKGKKRCLEYFSQASIDASILRWYQVIYLGVRRQSVSQPLLIGLKSKESRYIRILPCASSTKPFMI